MNKKILTIVFSICFVITCSFMVSACSCSSEVILTSISVQLKDIKSSFVEYSLDIEENFSINDFIITANYSDESSEELTEGVSFEPLGIFDFVTNTGKFVFTYNEKTAEIKINVLQKDISSNDFVVSGIEDSYTLESEEDVVRPEVTFSWNEITLVEDEDYYVGYGENNKNSVGENSGNVIVYGKGNFTGHKEIKFDIIGDFN